jgi:hypothetical protein
VADVVKLQHLQSVTVSLQALAAVCHVMVPLTADNFLFL